MILREAADHFATKRHNLVQNFLGDLRGDVDQGFAFGV
jgi:hypothetical protein